MSRSVLIGAGIVLVLLLLVVYFSSASVRKLRAEGQFGTPVETA